MESTEREVEEETTIVEVKSRTGYIVSVVIPLGKPDNSMPTGLKRLAIASMESQIGELAKRFAQYIDILETAVVSGEVKLAEAAIEAFHEAVQTIVQEAGKRLVQKFAPERLEDYLKAIRESKGGDGDEE